MDQLESLRFGFQLSPQLMFSIHGIDFYILQSVTALHKKYSVYRMEMWRRQTTRGDPEGVLVLMWFEPSHYILS